MTTEVSRNSWKEFFDEISQGLVGWETTVEIVSDEIGAQMLSKGLPFSGLTYEEKGYGRIELSLGEAAGNHVSHNVQEPVSVAFEGTYIGLGGVLNIEDKTGTKTLVRFVRPFPVLTEYTTTSIEIVN
jgi:hypothetical protein